MDKRFGCRFCPERFATQRALNGHLHWWHRKNLVQIHRWIYEVSSLPPKDAYEHNRSISQGA